MTDHRMTDSELEALFAAASAERPGVSPALLKRVMEDAMAEAEARAAPARAPRRAVRRGIVAGVIAAIGGWPAMGGLATAGVVGLWIGYSDPGALDAVTQAAQDGGYDMADLVPSLDIYLTEG